MVMRFACMGLMMRCFLLLTWAIQTPCFVVLRAFRSSSQRILDAPFRGTALLASSSSPPTPPSGLSGTSLGFLKNIEDYGRSRMARKAVGILSKMEAYGEVPVQEHYTAVIAACEQSEQFDTAIGVLREMKSVGVAPVVRTYEHLIGCAEKTGHWQAALALFEEMTHDARLRGTTTAYNHCMWAAEQGGRPDISLDLLADMEVRAATFRTADLRRPLTTRRAPSPPNCQHPRCRAKACPGTPPPTRPAPTPASARATPTWRCT